MNYEKLTQDLETIHSNVIQLIRSLMTERKINELNLDSPILYQYIDDQLNDVVSRVNHNFALIDTCIDSYFVKIDELSTETLITVLKAIETNKYDIFEEISCD